jgi:hypothetical protein
MGETVLENRDTNYKFNTFLYTFINIFEARFPVQNKSEGKTKIDWITQGIKIPCRHKGSLYIHIYIA